MVILHWVSRVLTDSMFRGQKSKEFIHVGRDMYKNSDFLYKSHPGIR